MLENVTDLRPSSEEQFIYFCKVQCSSCREIHPKTIGISRIVGPSLGTRLPPDAYILSTPLGPARDQR